MCVSTLEQRKLHIIPVRVIALKMKRNVASQLELKAKTGHGDCKSLGHIAVT